MAGAAEALSLSSFAAILSAQGLWLLLWPLLLLLLFFLRVLSRSLPVEAFKAAPREARASLLLGSWFLAVLPLGGVLIIQELGLRVRADLVAPAAGLALLLLTLILLALVALLLRPLKALLERLGRLGDLLTALFGLPLLLLLLIAPLLEVGKQLSSQAFVPLGALLLGLLLGLLPRLRPWRELWLLPPLLLLSFIGLQRYGARKDLQLILSQAPLSPWLLKLPRVLTDRDGDGFGTWPLPRDCRDDDPTIHPLAVDLPGDGIDQDCQGGDRPPYQEQPRGWVQHHPSPLIKPWNILLISVDALRADHLPFYGYTRNTAPVLNQLAQESWIAEHAYPGAHTTIFSLPTLLAGRPIAEMNQEISGSLPEIHPGNTFIQERLQEAGWQTAAHLSAQFRNGMWLGLERGFDDFLGHEQAQLKTHSVPALLKGGLLSLERFAEEEAPFLLWLHFLEPHEPYKQHKEHSFGKRGLDRYDGEIARTDWAVGQLLEKLDVLDLRAETLIILTSDHGEAFGEHGLKYHGRQLFEESIRVPLLIHVPGAGAARLREPVSLIDLPETLANLTGLEPGEDYGGRSLVGAFTGQQPLEPRSLLVDGIHRLKAQHARKTALIRWPYKFILESDTGFEQLYHLEHDPEEREELSQVEPERFANLRMELWTQIEAQRAQEHQRLRRHRVSREAPALKSKPVRVAPGILWLGSRISEPKEAGGVVRRVENWFFAEGLERPDIEIRIDIRKQSGALLRREQARPLANSYPSQRWASGEIIREMLLMRFGKKTGRAQVEMSIIQKERLIFGPRVLGRIKINPRR